MTVNAAGDAPVLVGRAAHRSSADQGVELGVALVDAGLHAAGQPLVAAFEAVDERLRVQPGAAVAEVLEPQRLERDVVGLTVERERLHDAVVTDLVEAAVEAELDAVAPGDVAPAAAGGRVPVEDLGVHPVGSDPAGEQLGIGVGPHQLRRRGVEVAGHADDRQGGIGLDRDLVAVAGGGHDAAPS